MAIINNAHPGSEISLLCQIYRVLLRNDRKLTLTDIGDLCRPENLPINENQRGKFHENLRFWMGEAHQLWVEDDESRLTLTRVAESDQPRAIAIVTNEALYESITDDIFAGENYQTEKLFKGLGCLLASDRFSLESGRRMSNTELDTFFAENLPESIPNNSEKPGLRSYGLFLGYLETDSKGEYVDPTRAIAGVLDKVFSSADELPIREFLERLAKLLPVLDGGAYREQVESRMVGPLSADPSSSKISRGLSLSIERLKFAHVLSYSGQSDDPNVSYLQTPIGDKAISIIRHHNSGATA
jgi:hypothetical protein